MFTESVNIIYESGRNNCDFYGNHAAVGRPKGLGKYDFICKRPALLGFVGPGMIGSCYFDGGVE